MNTLLAWGGIPGGLEVAIILLVITVLAWPFCKIFSKAGYPWALGLLMLIPVANIIMLFILAFAEWPIHRQLRSGRQPPELRKAHPNSVSSAFCVTLPDGRAVQVDVESSRDVFDVANTVAKKAGLPLPRGYRAELFVASTGEALTGTAQDVSVFACGRTISLRMVPVG
jgi:hypothetical protein